MQSKGDTPPQLPLVGGHEGAGVVVALGEGVTELEIGDYTGVKWTNKVDNKCQMCQTGVEQLCPNATLSGYTVDGSFQEYAITGASCATKIPKELDLCFLKRNSSFLKHRPYVSYWIHVVHTY